MTTHEQNLFDDLIAERDMWKKDAERLMLIAEKQRQELASLYAEKNMALAVENARSVSVKLAGGFLK